MTLKRYLGLLLHDWAGLLGIFSLIGAFWLMYLLGYNMSIAVWVGIIALAAGSAFFLLANRWYYVASIGVEDPETGEVRPE